MQRLRLDSTLYIELANLLNGKDGTEARQRLNYVARRCVAQLDSFGVEYAVFDGNLASGTISAEDVAALKTALCESRNARFKFAHTSQLFHLTRELRNRISRIRGQNCSADDVATARLFGNSLQEKMAAA